MTASTSELGIIACFKIVNILKILKVQGKINASRNNNRYIKKIHNIKNPKTFTLNQQNIKLRCQIKPNSTKIPGIVQSLDLKTPTDSYCMWDVTSLTSPVLSYQRRSRSRRNQNKKSIISRVYSSINGLKGTVQKGAGAYRKSGSRW